VRCVRPPRAVLDCVERCLRLRVLDVPFQGKTLPHLHRDALVAPEIDWEGHTRVTSRAPATGRQMTEPARSLSH
jgi:hypothetical protein